MKFGDKAYGGICAGRIGGHHIICTPNEYELPFYVTWNQATEYCKALGMELPTKEELYLLYELYKSNPKYFPKRKYHWYWSSTERSSTDAWHQSFSYGTQSTFNKSHDLCVRPIKRIEI